jgi:hypothetical protein
VDARDILENGVRIASKSQHGGRFFAALQPEAGADFASFNANPKGAVISIDVPQSVLAELQAQGLLSIQPLFSGYTQYIFEPGAFDTLNRYGWSLRGTNDPDLRRWYDEQIGC